MKSLTPTPSAIRLQPVIQVDVRRKQILFLLFLLLAIIVFAGSVSAATPNKSSTTMPLPKAGAVASGAYHKELNTLLKLLAVDPEVSLA